MFQIGSLFELSSGQVVEVVSNPPNPALTQIVFCDDPKNKKQSIASCLLTKLISSPLPFFVGDSVIDEDGIQGVVTSVSHESIEIRKPNLITSHNFLNHSPKLKKIDQSPGPIAVQDSDAIANQDPDDLAYSEMISQIRKSSRGGKRTGAGRPPSGNPPKKRKPLQLDVSLAAKLPNLKMLADLLDEFRPIAESGTLRSQRLADFYKKLDSLPYIC